MINRPLIPTEHVACKRFGERLDLSDELVEIGVSEDRQNRPEDFVFHDLVGPGDRVKDGRVEITGLGVGLSPINNLLGIDQGCKPFDGGGADDARVVRILSRSGP